MPAMMPKLPSNRLLTAQEYKPGQKADKNRATIPKIVSTKIIINVDKSIVNFSVKFQFGIFFLEYKELLELGKQLLDIFNAFIVCKHDSSVLILFI